MRFFVDNNLPAPLAQALHALSTAIGHEVIHLTALFPEDTEDPAWIEVLSYQGGWSVITHDKLNKGRERDLLRHSRLITFFLDNSWSDHKFWDKAHNMVRWWPRIIEQSEGVRKGTAFKVPYNFSGKGRFEPVRI